MTIGPLKSRNVTVAGRRTSLRLEASMWEALAEIAERERLSVSNLCTSIKHRIDEQARARGSAPDDSGVTLASAIRVFLAAYFRCAATDDGHALAGHGGGNPLINTPFHHIGPSEPDP